MLGAHRGRTCEWGGGELLWAIDSCVEAGGPLAIVEDKPWMLASRFDEFIDGVLATLAHVTMDRDWI